MRNVAGTPKRPTSVKRDLLQCQKRHTAVSKETYFAGTPVASVKYCCGQARTRLHSTARDGHCPRPLPPSLPPSLLDTQDFPVRIFALHYERNITR